MKKKYQVFISSTYTDLKEERMAVTQCLLDNDCIPVGMEQFPASGMTQMEYITKMLDDCDYYILILAGRYGSVDTDGIGFTEKEFDYAVSKKIPIMSFVVTDIGTLPNSKCETNDEARNRLNTFREKVCTGRMVSFYSDIGSLKANVATSVNRCKIDFPALGWVRGTAIETPQEELSELKAQVNETRELIDILLGQEQPAPPITKENIEKLFENETIILDGGNVGETVQKHSQVQMTDEETIDLKGMKLALEELAKRLPKISMGKETPAKLENGEIYIQHE